MIRTAYNNRFRDHKGAQGRAQRPGGRRDPAPRRDHASRRETATVVHPWMSLPDRLAAPPSLPVHDREHAFLEPGEFVRMEAGLGSGHRHGHSVTGEAGVREEAGIPAV